MKAYALTDIGKMRKVNQDAQFASTEPVGELSNLFVVADGMGGHQAGRFRFALSDRAYAGIYQREW